jgi:hypothetical protein
MQTLTLAMTDFAAPGPGSGALPRLPALEQLLARGERRQVEDADFRGWILGRAGFPAARSLPLAAVVAARPGHWALATPLQLLAGLERVNLHPAGAPLLEPAELQALVASFNNVLGGEGLALEALHSGQCLLSLPRAMVATTHDPGPLAGREASGWLPAGPDGAWLRRLMTEAQMLLHEHPVNLARVARGAQPVNALWLWGLGGGELPAPAAPLSPLASDDDFLRALWRRHGGRIEAAPEGLAATLMAKRDAVGVVTLALGGLAADPVQALQQVEERWFAPLAAALAGGRLGAVRIFLAGQEVEFAARHRFRVWRRGRPWQEVLA